jgi:UDPglucose 6-dehydrogenase
LGVRVKGYDPVAATNASRILPELVVEPTIRSLASGADALVLVTEWPEFREIDFSVLRLSMRTPLLVDGRNYFDASELVGLGFEYVAIGRG